MKTPLALIFDYDDTLAPDTTQGFLAWLGLDTGRFWAEANARVEQGFNPALAYLGLLLRYDREGRLGRPLSRGLLAEWGKLAPAYPGAENFFAEFRSALAARRPELEPHFFAISAGLEAILEHTQIRPALDALWAGDFHFDSQGRAEEIKRAITYTEKTRYLFQISKGLFGRGSARDDERVNERSGSFAIPLSHLIYVGDGLTDIPCFSLIRQHRGTALSVYGNARKEAVSRQLREQRRVSESFTADYRPGSALFAALLEAALRCGAEGQKPE